MVSYTFRETLSSIILHLLHLVISLFVLVYACYFFIRIDVCLLFLLDVLTYACYYFYSY